MEIAVNDGEVPNQVQVTLFISCDMMKVQLINKIIKFQVQGNGKCTVSFKPESCLPHVVDIKFNGQNVPGCPFTVDVSSATQFSVDLSQLELVSFFSI